MMVMGYYITTTTTTTTFIYTDTFMSMPTPYIHHVNRQVENAIYTLSCNVLCIIIIISLVLSKANNVKKYTLCACAYKLN